MPQFNISAYLSITSWSFMVIICLFLVMKKDIIPAMIEVTFLREFINLNKKDKDKNKDKDKDKFYNI